MKISAFIEILFVPNNSYWNIKNIIESFNNNGWNHISNSEIFFIEKGEIFEWVFINETEFEYFFSVITNKINNNEILGISFLNINSNHGMNVLIYPKLEKITFCLDINRKTIENSSSTDFEWYLDKIKPVLFSLKLLILNIECSDELNNGSSNTASFSA